MTKTLDLVAVIFLITSALGGIIWGLYAGSPLIKALIFANTAGLAWLARPFLKIHDGVHS